MPAAQRPHVVGHDRRRDSARTKIAQQIEHLGTDFQRTGENVIDGERRKPVMASGSGQLVGRTIEFLELDLTTFELMPRVITGPAVAVPHDDRTELSGLKAEFGGNGAHRPKRIGREYSGEVDEDSGHRVLHSDRKLLHHRPPCDRSTDQLP